MDQTLDEDEPRFRLVCGVRGVPPELRRGVPIVAGECPYRGLQIFDVAHAELFFGREKLTLDLVEMLRDQITSPALGCWPWSGLRAAASRRSCVQA